MYNLLSNIHGFEFFMYLQYWQFNEYPFENVPDPRFFYLSKSHEEALSRLLYAIRMRKGAAMVSGDIGCGKTTLAKVCLQELSADEFDIGLIINPNLEGVEFLQEVLYQLGVNETADTKAKCLRLINEKMLQNLNDRKETLLMIDEAHLLTSEALEELRLLMNFQLNDRFLITIVLLGQPELKEKICGLEQLDQRIPIKYHLSPFDLNDSVQYIHFRQRKAGREDNVFSQKAMEKVFESTKGVPRKINNLCDLALLVGFSKKEKEITPEVIEGVVNDGALL
jgi:general secretion pathway protein A